MKKAVIFDMDGVIVDTEPIYKQVNDDVYAKYGLEISEEELERYIGVSLIETWKDIMERYELNDDYELNDIIEDHIYNYYKGLEASEELDLMPGLEEWFKYLKEHDYKMIIASSSYEPIVEFIYQKFELGKYMQGYVDGMQVENGKPEPDIFIKALEKLGVDAEDCLVIEDSEHGVNAAKAAGIEVAAFNRREEAEQDLSNADLIIDEFNRKNLHMVFD